MLRKAEKIIWNSQLKLKKPEGEGKKYKVTKNKCNTGRIVRNVVDVSPVV